MSSKPKSAKCPEQYNALFVQTESQIDSLFKKMISNPSKGTIEIEGERYLLVRAASLSLDFYEYIMELYREKEKKEAMNVTRQLLFDLSHAIGKKDAEYFSKVLNLENSDEKLSAGPIHFAYTGWAFVDIFPESNLSPDKNYFIIYEHPYSFESASWMKAGKKSNVPICIMNAGYSSGWCEQCFGIPLVATEITCKAKGDESCRFIMAHPAHIEEYIKKYLEKQPELDKKITQYEIPGFFKLKIAEENLRQSYEKLALANIQLAQQAEKLEKQKNLLEKANINLQKADEQLKYIAYHDYLTDLPNRKSLEISFEEILKFLEKDKGILAVYFIDLNNFKIVNDTFGHAVGDELLIIISKRLQNSLRSTDMVARLGGDEFVIIARDILHYEEVEKLAEKIQTVIANPIVIESHEIIVTASVGISIYPTDGQSLKELIKIADEKLYQDKEQGHG